MPAASDWTTSVLTEEIGNHYRRTLVQCSGDGTMSYNSSGASGMGLPLPALGSLGMRRNLDYVNVVAVASDSNSGSRVWKYDKTTTNTATTTLGAAGSLRLYISNTTASITSPGEIMGQVTSGTVITTGTIYLECYGW